MRFVHCYSASESIAQSTVGGQVGSLRTGSISLRGLRLTRPLLEILRSDEVEIELSLDDNPSADLGVFSKRGSGDRLLYSTRANDFMDVCARVVNNSGQSSSTST